VADEYDSPWKERCSAILGRFWSFVFPAVAREIDWSRAVTSLEQELREVMRDAEAGRDRVDYLAKVFLKDGSDNGSSCTSDSKPARRPRRRGLYRYHARLRTGMSVRPRLCACWPMIPVIPARRVIEADLFGCRTLFEFFDLQGAGFPARDSEESTNPIAVVLAAHREAQRNPAFRRRREPNPKWRLVGDLYERAFANLYPRAIRLIDWILSNCPRN